MKTRKFGGSGIAVPVIGQGSWQLPERGKERERAIKALHRGIELGMVHIDTAEMYGDAELVIADAIKELPRESLFIVSKVLPSNASYPGTITALERSLKRLGTDYLDCYLLHWRGHIPLTDTLAAFEKLEKDGKIRSFGVSNFDVDDLEEALDCLTEGKIVCNQVLYNPAVRGIERKLLPFCREHEIALVGYTPYGSFPRKGDKKHSVLKDLAKKYDATERQIVLAFLIREEGTFTIPKASDLAHIEENAGASAIELSPADLALLDQHFPAPDRDTPLAML
ncbi:MAG: aldo/keto reductase [Candidatus Obscuribacterales bacterium]|nr:aldo/keto reductase [Candidatus Obscuribacterales bacterium]